ncbi:hypothetical protein AB0L53_57295 [Nonomuraea sp. NPDC052129]|uniref:hypothetical protein n=1 Tax=Nonomuraea sp. NPDC052129 TaxID=3154651 RepID=UPI0034123BB5
MKYVMLIFQGTALEGQAALSEEEQKQVYADYQGFNRTQAARHPAARYGGAIEIRPSEVYW